jgi:hypothetical protein
VAVGVDCRLFGVGGHVEYLVVAKPAVEKEPMTEAELVRVELLFEHAPAGVVAEEQWRAAKGLLDEVRRLQKAAVDAYADAATVAHRNAASYRGLVKALGADRGLGKSAAHRLAEAEEIAERIEARGREVCGG